MTLDNIRDVCTFCQHEGQLKPAIVSLRIAFELLAGKRIDHDDLLMQDTPVYACGSPVDSAAKVAKIAIDGAAQRVKRALEMGDGRATFVQACKRVMKKRPLRHVTCPQPYETCT